MSHIDILSFADDLNLIGDNKEIVAQNTSTLIEKAESVGLKIDKEKTSDETTIK